MCLKPIGSMNDVFTYIYHTNQPNVGNYAMYTFCLVKVLNWCLEVNCYKIRCKAQFHEFEDCLSIDVAKWKFVKSIWSLAFRSPPGCQNTGRPWFWSSCQRREGSFGTLAETKVVAIKRGPTSTPEDSLKLLGVKFRWLVVPYISYILQIVKNFLFFWWSHPDLFRDSHENSKKIRWFSRTLNAQHSGHRSAGHCENGFGTHWTKSVPRWDTSVNRFNKSILNESRSLSECCFFSQFERRCVFSSSSVICFDYIRTYPFSSVCIMILVYPSKRCQEDQQCSLMTKSPTSVTMLVCPTPGTWLTWLTRWFSSSFSGIEWVIWCLDFMWDIHVTQM